MMRKRTYVSAKMAVFCVTGPLLLETGRILFLCRAPPPDRDGNAPHTQIMRTSGASGP